MENNMELQQRIASLGQPVWDFCNIWHSFRSIEGFLHPFEGYMLYILSKIGEGDGEIVEIGSFMGLSTCWLAKGAKDAGRECVTAIDHFTGSVEHQENGVSYSKILEKEGTTFHTFMDNIKSRHLDDYVTPH